MCVDMISRIFLTAWQWTVFFQIVMQCGLLNRLPRHVDEGYILLLLPRMFLLMNMELFLSFVSFVFFGFLFYFSAFRLDLHPSRSFISHKLNFSLHFFINRYISNPLLIDGYKFDLRVYVAVTSYHPLRIYLYMDGLARLATEKYTTSKDCSNRMFMHLTNYSVNKKNSCFVQNNDADIDDIGNKWSLLALRRFVSFWLILKIRLWTLFTRILYRIFICAWLWEKRVSLVQCIEVYSSTWRDPFPLRILRVCWLIWLIDISRELVLMMKC